MLEEGTEEREDLRVKGVSRTQPNVAGGMGPKTKECRCFIEAGKGEEMDSPPEPLERNIALLKP